MTEWISENHDKAAIVSMIIVIALAAVGIWVGRRHLIIAMPVAVVWVLLGVIAIPSAIPAGTEAKKAACINNLRSIVNAKGEWARTHNNQSTKKLIWEDVFGTNVTQIPVCPSGGLYTIGTMNEDPTCSLAVRGHKLE